MLDKNNLKQKWINFVKAFFSPVPIFALLGAIILIIISIIYKERIEFSILINLIGSLLVGICGAFIKGGYDELARESILIKKGQSAIRNLNSIGQQIFQIRSWIKSFIDKKDLTKRELEEINRHLSTTEINIKSGLADWIDIVPELREESEMAKNYKDVIRGYIEEILKNKKELIIAGDNIELKEKLEKRVKELEKNIKELKKESPQTISHSSSPVSLSPSVFGPTIFGSSLFGIGNKICTICNKTYVDDNISYSALPYNNVCPECRKNNLSFDGFAGDLKK